MKTFMMLVSLVVITGLVGLAAAPAGDDWGKPKVQAPGMVEVPEQVEAPAPAEITARVRRHFQADVVDATEASTVTLCTRCGEITGSAKCCQPGEKCGKCGLHKGSPGCCKLNQL